MLFLQISPEAQIQEILSSKAEMRAFDLRWAGKSMAVAYVPIAEFAQNPIEEIVHGIGKELLLLAERHPR